MLRALKALPLALAVMASIIFAAGCGSSNSNARFVNAIADSNQALDIEFNGTKQFNDIGFPAASGSTYVSVPSGNDVIAGFAAGTTTNAAFTQNATLNSGSQYTLVATGFLSGSVTLLSPVDNNTAPADGSVSFRVIDASFSGPASVDIWIIPNPITNNLGCPALCPTITALSSPNQPTQATSSYVTMPFNSNGQGYSLFVAPSGSTNPLFGGQPINAGSSSLGTIRTLVLTDVANGGAMFQTPIVLDDLN